MKSPEEIVKIMYEKDAFSKWLNIEVLEVKKGYCKLQSTIHKNMLNGFEIAHGGISYSISDSALAFAANSHGLQCVSIETAISHLRPARVGDILTAECKEIHRGKSIAMYTVNVVNQENKDIAHFKGTVHISRNEW